MFESDQCLSLNSNCTHTAVSPADPILWVKVEFQRDFLTQKDGSTDPLQSAYEDLIDEAANRRTSLRTLSSECRIPGHRGETGFQPRHPRGR